MSQNINDFFDWLQNTALFEKLNDAFDWFLLRVVTVHYSLYFAADLMVGFYLYTILYLLSNVLGVLLTIFWFLKESDLIDLEKECMKVGMLIALTEIILLAYALWTGNMQPIPDAEPSYLPTPKFMKGIAAYRVFWIIYCIYYKRTLFYKDIPPMSEILQWLILIPFIFIYHFNGASVYYSLAKLMEDRLV